MTLSERLSEYLRAAFSGLYVPTFEPDDALAEITALCRNECWNLAVWDIDRGLTILGAQSESTSIPTASDPLAAVKSLPAFATANGTSLLVLRGFHRFLASAEVVQAIEHQLALGKTQRTFIVILAPTVHLPVELERLFVIVEHELPSREQLAEIVRGIATEPGELPEGPELESILAASSGLTRYEAEGAYSLSLVQEGTIRPQCIWDLKSQMLRKSGLMTVHRGGESFASLGGLDALKSFCTRAMRSQGNQNPLKRPRGVLLLSPPGCGKSAFAKALGNETGRPTLILDIGSLMGSLVGQTEGNVRQALKIADAMAPCVVFLDELDKGLAGVAGSGSTDSGVSARLFGTFLTWLSDHESDAYVVATCNDISKLPSELSRAERFDGVFFLDLPRESQKAAIWDMYIRLFELDPQQPKPRTNDWTGAEIRSCCRLAALLGVSLVEAAQNVVPVAVTAAESMKKLREWASGRCLDADTPGIYDPQSRKSQSARRKIPRDASLN